jgi:amidase
MQAFSPERALTRFEPTFEPIGAVELNESFVLESRDCYDGQFTSTDVLRPGIDMNRFNRATGPIWVNGLSPGEWVVVDVERVDVDGPGVMAVAPGLGTLGDTVTRPSTRLLPVASGQVWLTDQIAVPLDPMVGILGVATAAESVASSVPGHHGGNLDTRLIRAGTGVAFRVNQPGLGLAAGDLHAVMGDGELGGTGVEIGGRVQLSVRQLSGHDGTWPLLLTDDALHVLASAEDMTTAIRGAFSEAVKLIKGWHSLSWEDAYRLSSVVTHLQVSQVVNPRVTVRVAISRQWCPISAYVGAHAL